MHNVALSVALNVECCFFANIFPISFKQDLHLLLISTFVSVHYCAVRFGAVAGFCAKNKYILRVNYNESMKGVIICLNLIFKTFKHVILKLVSPAFS
jgi:hypothetical protein